MQAKTQIRTITQEHVVDFCSALSYDGMLLIGGLADIVEGKSINDVILANARSLQNQLKLGLSDEFHIWLYSQGYSDREVAKHIAEKLQKVMSANNNFDPKVLRVNQALLADILSNLPTVFSEVKVR